VTSKQKYRLPMLDFLFWRLFAAVRPVFVFIIDVCDVKLRERKQMAISWQPFKCGTFKAVLPG
jgi:hypothetical protein